MLRSTMLPLATRRVSDKLRRPPPKVNSRKAPFDVKVFLESVGLGRKVGAFRGKETIFTQGDLAENVMYI